MAADEIIILPPMISALSLGRFPSKQVSTDRRDVDRMRNLVVDKTCLIIIPKEASGADRDVYLMAGESLAASIREACNAKPAAPPFATEPE